MTVRQALGLALALATPALAQEQTGGGQNRSDQAPQVATEPASYTEGLLFKDWRKRLYEQGIDPHLSFVTESSGGIRGVRGTRFTEQIEFGLKLDMAKVAGIKGGKFNLVLTNREGADLSTDKIGNLFRVQEVFGANKDLRLVYLTWEQSFADGRVAWLLGRTNVAQDFAYSKLWCNFQNNGLCGRPRALPANGGFSNYPLSAWGTRLKWKPFPGGDSCVQIGAFEANPDLAIRDGFQFGFKHDTGVTLPIEGALVVGNEKAGTLGTYKLGGYYDTSNVKDQFEDLTGQPLALTGRPAQLHGGPRHRLRFRRSDGGAAGRRPEAAGDTARRRHVRAQGSFAVPIRVVRRRARQGTAGRTTGRRVRRDDAQRPGQPRPCRYAAPGDPGRPARRGPAYGIGRRGGL